MWCGVGGSHDVGLVYRECGVGWVAHDVGLVYRECGVGWVAHMMLALCIGSVVWGGWLT